MVSRFTVLKRTLSVYLYRQRVIEPGLTKRKQNKAWGIYLLETRQRTRVPRLFTSWTKTEKIRSLNYGMKIRKLHVSFLNWKLQLLKDVTMEKWSTTSKHKQISKTSKDHKAKNNRLEERSSLAMWSHSLE